MPARCLISTLQFPLSAWALFLVLGCSGPSEPPDPGAEATETVARTPALPPVGGAASAGADLLPGELRSYPLRERNLRGETRFAEVSSAETAINFVNELEDQQIWQGDYRATLNGSLGSGTCIGDVDLDGRPDLYLVSREGQNRLFRQVGDFHFEDITRSAEVGSQGRSSGACFADIDNDGDLDLFLCREQQTNQLFVNDGKGKFTEQGNKRGVDFAGASVMASFSDYDRDGDLDLYLVTNRVFLSEREMDRAKRKFMSGKIEMKDGFPVVPPELEEAFYFLIKPSPSGQPAFEAIPAGQRDHLYRNEGDGTFTEVTKQAGIIGAYRGHCAAWWDYDQDGWPDLHVANDFYDPDQLFHNNGDGTFTEVAGEVFPHLPWFSMGSDFADVNRDGLFDLMTTDMAATSHFKRMLTMGNLHQASWFLTSSRPRQFPRNALYLNTGIGRFLECANLAGLSSSDWTWTTRFGDLDNDGWSDLFFANGMIRRVMDSDLQDEGARRGANRDHRVMGELLRESQPQLERNLAFRNQNGWEFEGVGESWGLNHKGISTSAALADLDRDGDLDLVVNHYNEPVSLYRNQGTAERGVLIRLRGTSSNRFGVGAKVTAIVGTQEQTKCMQPTRGYMSSDDPVLHFGLGDADEVSELRIDWPSGGSQILHSLAADHLHVIAEPEEAPAESALQSPEFLFTEVSQQLGLEFRHEERSFNDYARQPLLPYQPSQQGPGQAWGDADGDGDEDVFFGGAVGQAGVLYLYEQGENRFVARRGPLGRGRQLRGHGLRLV